DRGVHLLVPVSIEVVGPQDVADFVDRLGHQQNAAEHSQFGFEILWRQLALKATPLIGSHRSFLRGACASLASGSECRNACPQTTAEGERPPADSIANQTSRTCHALAAAEAAADGTTHTLTSVSASRPKCSLTVYMPSS